MPKAKTKKGDQNTTVNVIDDINEIIGDMNQAASQDEEELIKLEKIASEIDEAEQAVSNIPQPAWCNNHAILRSPVADQFRILIV